MSAPGTRQGGVGGVHPDLWMPGQPLQGLTFKKGDGFDVYIDFARHLPDSTTITRVRRLCKLWANDGA